MFQREGGNAGDILTLVVDEETNETSPQQTDIAPGIFVVTFDERSTFVKKLLQPLPHANAIATSFKRFQTLTVTTTAFVCVFIVFEISAAAVFVASFDRDRDC